MWTVLESTDGEFVVAQRRDLSVQQYITSASKRTSLTSRMGQSSTTAKTSALLAVALAWRESAAAWSSRYSASSKNSSLHLSSWKTCRPLGPVEQNEWSKNWPASGMTVGGTCYPLMMWERRTREKGGFFSAQTSQLWPTPSVQSGGQSIPLDATWVGKTTAYNKDGKKLQVGLQSAVRMWPTPNAVDYKGPSTRSPGKERPVCDDDLPTRVVRCGGVSGQLNPAWVESYLMGFPLGWTELSDSVMQWYRSKPVKPLKG